MSSAPSVVAMGGVSLEKRETVLCKIIGCGMNQFRTADGLCRKCHQPLPPSDEELLPPRESLAEQPDRGKPIDVDPLIIGMPRAVKKLREVRHLSQRQLATQLATQRTWVSKVENGVTFPTAKSLERLADGLQVSVFDLVSLAAAPPREFAQALENILILEEILLSLRRASTEDRAFFYEYAESLCLRRAEQA